MKSKLNKIALALGTLAILGAATQASAVPTFPTFSVTPGALGIPAPFNAPVPNLDTIKGGASERLIANMTGTGFSGNGLLTLDGFYSGANLKFTPSSFGKQLYITFSTSATLTSGAFGAPGSTYHLDTLDFKIFADLQGDDTFSTAANGSDPTATNSANDTLLGFGSLLGGTAAVNSGGGSTGGALNSSEYLSLCSGLGTATNPKTGDTRALGCTSNIGTGFFSQPNPFYNVVFDEFNNTSAVFNPATGELILTGGSGSINFAIPEPDSIALLGIAAVGAGLLRRRRKA